MCSRNIMLSYVCFMKSKNYILEKYFTTHNWKITLKRKNSNLKNLGMYVKSRGAVSNLPQVKVGC